jgi:hypothetical protein
MSGDEPSKVVPGAASADNVPRAEPLDDIILDEDGDGSTAAALAPAPIRPSTKMRSELPPRPSSPLPPLGSMAAAQRGSVRPRPSEAPRGSVSPEARAKATLHLPSEPPRKDVLSERSLAAADVAFVPLGASSAPESIPPARTSLRPPPPESFEEDTALLRTDLRDRRSSQTNEAGLAAVALGVDPSSEAGWTPFQPEVGADLPPIKPSPIVGIGEPANGKAAAPSGPGAFLDRFEVDNADPPIIEDISVDMDFGSVPDLAAQPAVAVDDRLTDEGRPPDSEDVRFDDVDRISGEVEVDADDLVSVETLAPAAESAPVEPTPAKAISRLRQRPSPRHVPRWGARLASSFPLRPPSSCPPPRYARRVRS